MKNIAVLGSTGSIGTQTLQIAENDKNINICALAAKSNVKLLAEQVRKFKPVIACIADEEKYSELAKETRDLSTKIVCGADGMAEVSSVKEADSVLNSVVGIAGLIPTVCAVKAKKRLLLANKETLVCAGEIVMSLARENNVDVIPVGSEHSAIFQCLNGENREKIKNIWLTASGGPFFGKTAAELQRITPEEALRHPHWTMGAKITSDSASLRCRQFMVSFQLGCFLVIRYIKYSIRSGYSMKKPLFLRKWLDFDNENGYNIFTSENNKFIFEQLGF